MLPSFVLLFLVASLACAVLLSVDRQSHSTNPQPNASSLILLNSSSLAKNGVCFDASADHRLLPAEIIDCLDAVIQLGQKGSLARPIFFTRRWTKGFFKLPQVFRHETCVISVDVVHDTDEDKFPFWVAEEAARDLSMQCVGGSSHLGGKKFFGPKKVVYVLVFGRNPPSAPTNMDLVQGASPWSLHEKHSKSEG